LTDVVRSFCTIVVCTAYVVFTRNEHRFLLAGLKVPCHSDWAARQAAYLAAVKEFLLKLNPDFTSIEVTFVKALNIGRKEDKRLFLSVDCKDVQQYVNFPTNADFNIHYG
jgi:hypothetical protein